MANTERGLEFDETVQQMADIAIGEANRWQQGGLAYKEAMTMLVFLTQHVCIEIVAATCDYIRDPAEYARSVESILMDGFADKVVARAKKFKIER